MGYTMVCSACAVVQDRVCSSERRELGVGGDDAGQRQGLEEGVGSFWYGIPLDRHRVLVGGPLLDQCPRCAHSVVDNCFFTPSCISIDYHLSLCSYARMTTEYCCMAWLSTLAVTVSHLYRQAREWCPARAADWH